MPQKILCCLLFYAVMGLLCFPVGRRLSRLSFRADRFPFASRKWERDGRIYAALGIRDWQGAVPDMSRLFPAYMPEKKLDAGRLSDEEHLRVLVNESCVAELVHLLLCVFGLWTLRILPGRAGLTLWQLYVLLGNLPYIVIQRYNRPIMMRTLRRIEARGKDRARGGPSPSGLREEPEAEDLKAKENRPG